MSKPNFFERFQAGWKAATNSDLPTKDGAIDFNEEAVAGFEATVKELEDLRADNSTLKDAAGTHAQAVSDLEDKVTAAEAKATAADAKLEPITAALKANNVEVTEGADPVVVAVEKINAWGAAGGKKTGVQVGTADELNSSAPDPTMTDIDRAAQERYDRMHKK